MGTKNQLLQTVFSVTDLFGVAVTGLADGAFTKTLKRLSSGTLAAAAETVTVTEIGSGDYYASFTPTYTGIYTLDISHATNTVYQRDREFLILSGFAASGGPYLTTRANVKTALDISGTQDDDRIDALLAQVTDEIQTYCDRTFALGSGLTEYPEVRGYPLGSVILVRTPVVSVTSLHFSDEWPCVYDSTTLLTEDTDYVVDSDSGVIRFVCNKYPTGLPVRSVRVVYDGGYSTIPADLERAAIELIAAKLMKGKHASYHVTSRSAADGSISGIRFDDWTDAMRRVCDRYRRMVVV